MRNKKNFFITVLLVLSVAMLVFSSCNKDGGSIVVNTEKEIKDVNYITVTGKGVAKGNPDVATFRVAVDEIAPSTSEALNNANQKVAQIYEVLEKYGVKRSDTKTSSLSIGPRSKYDYERKEDVLLGQAVSESISVRIENFSSEDDKKLGSIIDDLGKITGIQINAINFSVKDEESLYKDARKLAVKKALEKIEDYASEAGVTIKEIKTITEGNDATPYFSNARVMYKTEAVAMDASYAGTSIVSGEFEVSSTVSVVASFE